MSEDTGTRVKWLDVLWLVLLAGLALLPPLNEFHKQLTLLAIGTVQLAESRIVSRLPTPGPHIVVQLKILLATVLLNLTAEASINSSYYPDYYGQAITAFVDSGTWGT